MLGKLTKELKEINNNIKTLLVTSVAKHLSQYAEGRAASSMSVLPVSDVDNLVESPSVKGTKLDQSLTIVKVATTKPYTVELLSSAEITPVYMKSHNRPNFVALLVKRFDVPTRMRCTCLVGAKINLILIS